MARSNRSSKICSKCKKDKPRVAFRPRTDKPHLLMSRCRECQNDDTRNKRNSMTVDEKLEYMKHGRELARLRRRANPHYKDRFYGLGKYRFYQSRLSAIRHGHTWSLDRELYYKLIQEQCHYCGGKVNERGIGLDRIDSNVKDYNKNNVVPCCGRCNWVKGNWFTYEQMLQLGEVIKKFSTKERTIVNEK